MSGNAPGMSVRLDASRESLSASVSRRGQFGHVVPKRLAEHGEGLHILARDALAAPVEDGLSGDAEVLDNRARSYAINGGGMGVELLHIRQMTFTKRAVQPLNEFYAKGLPSLIFKAIWGLRGCCTALATTMTAGLRKQ